MDSIVTLIALLASALSLCTSGVYAYIALKKSKEPPKDEIWETAVRLVCARGEYSSSADEFVEVYRGLKLFKEHPEKLAEHVTIEAALLAESVKQATQAESRQSQDGTYTR